MSRGQHREPASGPSQRQLRVGELVRHAMSDLLTRGEVHDPVLEGHLITVPEVRMSADLRLATIYVMQGEIYSDIPYGQHGSAERVERGPLF